ncbi:MAG: helix-turn-helix transcriptional regulator [Bacteroidales bacterium]|nr:helix-turn-helix transcriptional regulator [Bacteroidales bacterium]
MILHIKNMVCPRCIMAVKSLLQSEHLTPVSVELGIAEIKEDLDFKTLDLLRGKLKEIGFGLLEDKKDQIISRIKSLIINIVHYEEELPEINISEYLSKELNMDYSTLSKLFSQHAGLTIEKFFILQRIERAKELLADNELSLNEIAIKLGYSSTAYLSSQFKSVTGYTPSQYKSLQIKERISLDNI